MRYYKIICYLVGYGRQVYFRLGESKLAVQENFYDEMLSLYRIIIKIDISEIF